MQILLGPILYTANQTSPTNWEFYVQVFLEDDQSQDIPSRISLKASEKDVQVSAPVQGEKFFDSRSHQGSFWYWKLSVPREEKPRRIGYQLRIGRAVARNVDDVCIPALGHLPATAFYSCNGVEAPSELNVLPDAQAVWKQLQKEHKESGFNLLIGGGDQVYADFIFASNPTLKKIWQDTHEGKKKVVVDKALQVELLDAYLGLYREVWNTSSVAGEVLARIPMVCMWDDHDIIDGWGSHPEELQTSPLFKEIFAAARRTYLAIQVGPGAGLLAPKRGHLFQSFSYQGASCELDIVLLDLRSCRTMTQVLGEEQWKDFDRWRLDYTKRPSGKKRHVVLVSTIPVLHLRLRQEAVAPADLVGLRDDLLDQWEAPPHRGERARLISDLVDLSRQSRASVTILAGDIHVGSWVRLTAHNSGQPDVTINQVVSSGIVHPPMSKLMIWGLKAISVTAPEELTNIETSFLLINNDQFLLFRNYASIAFDPPGAGDRSRLWVEWKSEGPAVSSMVVVEPQA